MAFVQAITATSGSAVTSLTTAAITTTTGNTVAMATNSFSSTNTFPTPTDSKSNTWNAHPNNPQLSQTSGATDGAFYADSVTGGSGHTFTGKVNTADTITVIVLEFSGRANPSLDATGHGQSGANQTSKVAGTITTLTTGADVVAFNSDDVGSGTQTITAGSGWTSTAAMQQTSAAETVAMAQYRANQAIGTYTNNGTTSQSSGWAGLMFAFKPAGSATTVGWQAPSSWPGRSPGRAPQSARFYQSPKAYIPTVPGPLSGISVFTASAVGELNLSVPNPPWWPPPNTFHPGKSPGQAPQSARFYQSPTATNAVHGIGLEGVAASSAAATGDLTGSLGTLSGIACTITASVGAAGGSGVLSGVAVTSTVAVGDLEPFSGGAIAGVSAATTVSVGAMGGSGTLSGISAPVSVATGGLLGAGIATGVSVTTKAASGALLASGVLAGSSVSITVAIGDLSGSTGTLGGISLSTTVGIGDLQPFNTGSIQGVAVATSVAVAQISFTTIVPPPVQGGGGGGKLGKRKKKVGGPVMRDDQVFGEEYPVSPFLSSERSSRKTKTRKSEPDYAMVVKAMLEELL